MLWVHVLSWFKIETTKHSFKLHTYYAIELT